MRTLRLKRSPSVPEGTLGLLLRENGSRLAWTMELPWRGNARGASCIPSGRYLCVLGRHPKHGEAYEVTGVRGRSSILIHSGCVAGYPAPPYETHSLGCILPGFRVGRLRGQLAVLVSRPAVSAIMRETEGKPFWLEVSWASSTS